MLDYYGILGVGKGDSTSDIRKRFRMLSLIHHPDKGGDEDRYRVMLEAYTVLCDESLRRDYDEKLRKLEAVPRVRRDTSAETVWTDIYVTLSDAVKGCVKHVEYGKSTISVAIRAGVSDGEEILCGRCGGVEVKARVHVVMEFGYSFERYRSDRVLTLSVSLPKSSLGKTVRINLFGDTVPITFPENVRDGGYVKLRNMGYPKDGKRGYLYIKVHINSKKTI